MNIFMKKNKRFDFVCALIEAFLLLLAWYKIKPIFFTTHSPGGTYTVNLKGQKERPALFTAEVRFNVLKNGESFWSDQYLHSGDAMDLSFEVGYPNHRWLGENVLRFYHDEDFNAGKSQVVVIVNKTNKVIKSLKFETDPTDKYLLFDIQPGTEIRLPVSPPKGDYEILSIEGKFYEERSFDNVASFKINKEINEPFTYQIYITDDALTIENSQLEKYIPKTEQ